MQEIFRNATHIFLTMHSNSQKLTLAQQNDF